VRHPLDVALSTARIAAHRQGVSEWHEKNLVIEEGTAIPNTLFNAVLRWRRWNGKIRRGLAARDQVRVRYEDLVSRPVPAFESLFQHLQEPFDPGILDYGQFPSLFPGWEWGSADVKRAGAINTASLERWKRELIDEEAKALLSLAGPSEPSAAPSLTAGPAGPAAQSPAADRIFLDGLSDLAVSLGLPPGPAGSAGSAPARWWFSGLDAVDWTNTRLVAIGAGFSPLPWFLSLLGAKVTLVDTAATLTPRWEEWQRRLKVDVNARIVPDIAVPLPIETGSADIVLADAFTPRNPAGMDRDLAELARLLRPGGLLAVSSGSPSGVGPEIRAWREQLQRQRTFRLLNPSGEKPANAAPNASDSGAEAALLVRTS
jgi:hypothetical protein